MLTVRAFRILPPQEIAMYQKEQTAQEEKIAKMKDSGADAHDVRKQEEVLAETTAMIPDRQAHLATSSEELELFLEEVATHPGLAGSAQLVEAQALLA